MSLYFTENSVPAKKKSILFVLIIGKNVKFSEQYRKIYGIIPINIAEISTYGYTIYINMVGESAK